MLLSKGGITIDVAHPLDIARYKKLGFVEPEVGYPKPVETADGKNPPETAGPKTPGNVGSKADAKAAKKG